MARILIADGMPMIRSLVCRSLNGHEAIPAGTGQEALELLGRKHPRIAILDAGLPGLSGLEVCRAISADPALSATIVVLVVPSGDFSSEQLAQLADVRHILHKPFMPQQVSRLVERILATQPE